MVEKAEPIERALLGGQMPVGWAGGRGLQGAMHPFVGAVLLWTRRQDPLVLNAQPDPPHVELREAVDAGGGERHPVVGADGARQPVLAEEALENGPDAHALGRQQPVTGQQVARGLVGDGERIAVDAIAGPEVALEVCRPMVSSLRGVTHVPGQMCYLCTRFVPSDGLTVCSKARALDPSRL